MADKKTKRFPVGTKAEKINDRVATAHNTLSKRNPPMGVPGASNEDTWNMVKKQGELNRAVKEKWQRKTSY